MGGIVNSVTTVANVMADANVVTDSNVATVSNVPFFCSFHLWQYYLCQDKMSIGWTRMNEND